MISVQSSAFYPEYVTLSILVNCLNFKDTRSSQVGLHYGDIGPLRCSPVTYLMSWRWTQIAPWRQRISKRKCWGQFTHHSPMYTKSCGNWGAPWSQTHLWRTCVFNGWKPSHDHRNVVVSQWSCHSGENYHVLCYVGRNAKGMTHL